MPRTRAEGRLRVSDGTGPGEDEDRDIPANECQMQHRTVLYLRTTYVRRDQPVHRSPTIV